MTGAIIGTDTVQSPVAPPLEMESRTSQTWMDGPVLLEKCPGVYDMVRFPARTIM